MEQKPTIQRQKKPRGLALVTPERRKEIARMGGKAIHKKPSGLAAVPKKRRKEIGRSGGLASAARGKQPQLTHEEAVRRGRLGGRQAWANVKPEDRSDLQRRRVLARWAKDRQRAREEGDRT